MLRLEALQWKPFWLHARVYLGYCETLTDFHVEVRPVTVAMILSAREAANNAKFEAISAGAPEQSARAKGDFVFTRSIAQAGIVSWQGIADADGKPVEVTPETIDAALENLYVYQFLDENYVAAALTRMGQKSIPPRDPAQVDEYDRRETPFMSQMQNGGSESTGAMSPSDSPTSTITTKGSRTTKSRKRDRGTKRLGTEAND